MSEEIEAQLDEVERKTAACYADSEELAHQIRKATEQVKRESRRIQTLPRPASVTG